MKNLIVLSACLLTLAGCAGVMQGLHNFAADPNATGAVETGAQDAISVLPFLGPVGAAIAGILTGLLAAWRKIKPTLAAAKTEATQYHAAAASVVGAIEAFKAAYPDQWDNLGQLVKDQLTRQGIDPLTVENVIRGLRGLPAKEPA